MYILGIAGFYHDSAACLIKDGEIIVATEEERFNRVKHTKGIPHQAIKYCLERAEITLDQIDYIGYYWNPWLWLKERLIYRTRMFYKTPFFSIADIFNVVYQGFLPLLELKTIKSPNTKIFLVNHHFSHAASAFFVSPYDRAAILTLDMFGERATTLLAIGENNNIKRINEVKYPHSIGALYAAITEHLGFQIAEDEYKVMGLASYGKPRHYDDLKKLIEFKPMGSFKLDLKYFNYQITGYSRSRFVSDRFIKEFGPPRKPNEKISQFHMDFAASLQKLLEETVLHILNYLYDISKEKNLCMAGGIALNSVMNGRLLEESPFKNIFIQPAAHDAGCALGCSYYIYNQILNKPRNYILEHVFFGPEFANEQIRKELELNKLTYKYYDNIEEIAAKLLAQNKIIGWFQGRMEWGPRALGNRSILASPLDKNMKDMVNICVKNREEFRPFAPAVLEEEMKKYFKIDYLSPYMLFVCDVKKEARPLLPAITHIDGTARVQTVNKEVNPRFWKVIKEFGKITGIPVLLNTSFNVRGEPIVCNPKDAIRCFYSTGLDYLIMGNYLLSKK